jgi:hypothetical protein
LSYQSRDGYGAVIRQDFPIGNDHVISARPLIILRLQFFHRIRKIGNEAIMADWYYYNENNEKIGPMSGGELKQLARQGTVTQETLVEDPGGKTRPMKEVNGMTFWYYYDDKGQKKGPFTGDQLKELVKQGLVTRETILENDTGQSGPARKVGGLPFPQIAQPAQPSPVGPNPFTAPLPMSDNPFTAPNPPNNTKYDSGGNGGTVLILFIGIIAVVCVCGIGWKVINERKAIVKLPIEPPGGNNRGLFNRGQGSRLGPDPSLLPPQKSQEQREMEQAVVRADAESRDAARDATTARNAANDATSDAAKAGSTAALAARDAAVKAAENAEAAAARAVNRPVTKQGYS